MSQFSTAIHYYHSTNVNTEMLASAMMLISLSEGAPVHTPYKSCFSQASSCNSSGNSLNGWGSAMTRKSYKTNLCSLGSSSETVVQPISQSQPADTEESSWGYYADTQ
jgi:hypothetical protein